MTFTKSMTKVKSNSAVKFALRVDKNGDRSTSLRINSRTAKSVLGQYLESKGISSFEKRLLKTERRTRVKFSTWPRVEFVISVTMDFNRPQIRFTGDDVMLEKLMNGPLRFAVYLAVIVASVVGGVIILQDERPPVNRTGLGPVIPKSNWKLTSEIADAANEGFSVEVSAPPGVSVVPSKSGNNWTQFNGPSRTNRSSDTDLLKSWPESGPPLLWAVRGLGRGYSSVSVVDGVVYSMGNKQESEALMALEASTGEKIWSVPYARASHPSNGDGPRSTPSFSDGSVYGLGAEGELVCLDAKTGKIHWQMNILSKYVAPNLGWGICESVLIDGPQLICTPGGTSATLVALDKNSGKEIWKCLIGTEKAGYASTVAADVDGVRQYIQFLAEGTVGVRADDGKFLWRNNQSSSGTANCSSPLVDHHFVFTAANYGAGGTLLKLTAAGRQTEAELVYHTRNMKNHHGDMVIFNGMLFGSNDPGILMCLDLATGKTKWQNRSIGKGAVTFADGCIYLRGENGSVALVEATGEEYRELGRFEQPHRSSAEAWSHPVVAHGCLFLRDQDFLLCYDLRTGPALKSAAIATALLELNLRSRWQRTTYRTEFLGPAAGSSKS